MQRKVTVAAGAGFTNILASIPCHYLKVWPDADRNVAALEYQTPDDNFATTFTTDSSIGDFIERIGHGRKGILGRPPNYNASGFPATGDVILKVRFADAASRDVTVLESENEL